MDFHSAIQLHRDLVRAALQHLDQVRQTHYFGDQLLGLFGGVSTGQQVQSTHGVLHAADAAHHGQTILFGYFANGLLHSREGQPGVRHQASG